MARDRDPIVLIREAAPGSSRLDFNVRNLRLAEALNLYLKLDGDICAYLLQATT